MGIQQVRPTRRRHVRTTPLPHPGSQPQRRWLSEFIHWHDDQRPPELQVPFIVSSSGGITATSASVSTTTRFNATDVGKTGAVYVTAIVPSGALSAAQKAMSVRSASPTATSKATTTSSFVLMQLPPLGLATGRQRATDSVCQWRAGRADRRPDHP